MLKDGIILCLRTAIAQGRLRSEAEFEGVVKPFLKGLWSEFVGQIIVNLL